MKYVEIRGLFSSVYPCIRTRKNCIFGHVSGSNHKDECRQKLQCMHYNSVLLITYLYLLELLNRTFVLVTLNRCKTDGTAVIPHPIKSFTVPSKTCNTFSIQSYYILDSENPSFHIKISSSCCELHCHPK